ncbi:hypothetical protein A9798_08395 [Edwardsiella hoshinae]|uniref:Hemolysin n=1 Tax=Edwardsiella hoshinae TaxID=93378 RepID=A0A376DG77_9GAMM|nr:DUF333 domain-containing protein [Edwardsiella hoshinae]AOV96981.1 hypothetical protein A9798_08395 [Edwardsiella hoshinae]QPR27167.1 DUF333 domain-containing protein [Edwardsiella hoshinae]STC88284.1 Putative hemolysin [Edwardsiella hoshinae]
MRVGVCAVAWLALALTGCADEAAQQTAKASPHIAASAALSEGCALVGGEIALAHQLDGSALVQCQLPDGKRCTERGVLSGNCPN